MSSAPLLVANTQDSAIHPFGVPFYCCLIWKTSVRKVQLHSAALGRSSVCPDLVIFLFIFSHWFHDHFLKSDTVERPL